MKRVPGERIGYIDYPDLHVRFLSAGIACRSLLGVGYENNPPFLRVSRGSPHGNAPEWIWGDNGDKNIIGDLANSLHETVRSSNPSRRLQEVGRPDGHFPKEIVGRKMTAEETDGEAVKFEGSEARNRAAYFRRAPPF